MFQKRHNHTTGVLGAGILGMMLGFAGAFALAYPEENHEKTEGFLLRAKDRLNELFQMEEEKPRKSKKRLLSKRTLEAL